MLKVGSVASEVPTTSPVPVVTPEGVGGGGGTGSNAEQIARPSLRSYNSIWL